MEISKSLVKQFAKLTAQQDTQKDSETVYGYVHKTEGSDQAYVMLDGSSTYTPVESTVMAKDGARVMVQIKNHTATIIGSTSDQATSEEYVQTEIEAVNARFDNLSADNILAKQIVTNALSADDADIKNLVVSNIDAGSINGYQIKNSYILAKALSNETIETLVGSKITYAAIEPENPKENDLWYKTIVGDDESTSEILYTYQNGAWILADLDYDFFKANCITAREIYVEDLYALGATIGGFDISEKSISHNVDLDGFIGYVESYYTSELEEMSVSKVENKKVGNYGRVMGENSVYIGEDGILLGKYFEVTNEGYLTASAGQIGSFSLTAPSTILAADTVYYSGSGNQVAIDKILDISDDNQMTFLDNNCYIVFSVKNENFFIDIEYVQTVRHYYKSTDDEESFTLLTGMDVIPMSSESESYPVKDYDYWIPKTRVLLQNPYDIYDATSTDTEYTEDIDKTVRIYFRNSNEENASTEERTESNLDVYTINIDPAYSSYKIAFGGEYIKGCVIKNFIKNNTKSGSITYNCSYINEKDNSVYIGSDGIGLGTYFTATSDGMLEYSSPVRTMNDTEYRTSLLLRGTEARPAVWMMIEDNSLNTGYSWHDEAGFAAGINVSYKGYATITGDLIYINCDEEMQVNAKTINVATNNVYLNGLLYNRNVGGDYPYWYSSIASDYFTVTDNTFYSSKSISPKTYDSDDVTFYKTDYFPIAIVGHYNSGTCASYINDTQLFMLSRYRDSCTIRYGYRNLHESTTAVFTTHVFILWIKCID